MVAFVAVTALDAQEAVPVKFPTKVVEVTEVSPAKVVEEAPNAIAVDPTVTELFAKLAFGTAAKPNVKVSVDAFAEIVKPCPDDEAKFKDPVVESDIKNVPPNDAVEYAFFTPRVPAVKYPESLFNCEILLPDTITFFQVAICFYVFILLINMPNY